MLYYFVSALLQCSEMVLVKWYPHTFERLIGLQYAGFFLFFQKYRYGCGYVLWSCRYTSIQLTDRFGTGQKQISEREKSDLGSIWVVSSLVKSWLTNIRRRNECFLFVQSVELNFLFIKMMEDCKSILIEVQKMSKDRLQNQF